MLEPLTTSADQPLLADRLGPVQQHFSHADDAAAVLASDIDDLQIITGFGPTNAPTAGTLSVMFGIDRLQRQLDRPMTVVISELGAWNSRNVSWERLVSVRDQMIAFLSSIGIDTANVTIRSHLDKNNLVRAGKIARFLTRQDFLEHREALLDLYDDHGLLGSEIGVVVDSLYTVADILQPVDAGASHVLMVSGMEEAYFTELARLVLRRQQAAGELSLGWKATIGALYFRVLEGLGGYPKMSKSIPDSCIHLGMSHDLLAERILDDAPESQPALMSAIELASGWDNAELANARDAYTHRRQMARPWRHAKRSYLDTFITLADKWASNA